MSVGKPCRAFEVDISVQNNTLVVGVNGGNVTGAPDDRIIWRAGNGVKTFTLQFFQLGAEPAANEERKRIMVQDLFPWPFTGEPPRGGIVGPTERFEGTLTGPSVPATAFKYSITVGNLQLDPVVIVDR
jgi:hypothetical protein